MQTNAGSQGRESVLNPSVYNLEYECFIIESTYSSLSNKEWLKVCLRQKFIHFMIPKQKKNAEMDVFSLPVQKSTI